MINWVFSLVFVLPASAQQASTAVAHAPVTLHVSTPITVVYPAEGTVLPEVSSTLIYGAVTRPKAAFRINGKLIKPHALGGYLDYLPVSPGTFTFHCELDLPGATTTYDRTVLVPAPPVSLSTLTAQIDPNSLQPAEDLELRAGDLFVAQMRASSGARAEFQIQGQKQRFPMAETNQPGLYQGVYQTLPGETIKPAPVRFFLKTDKGSGATAASRGKVMVQPGPPAVAMVTSASAVIRTGPNSGYLNFPPIGTRLVVLGRQGSEVKIQLSQTLIGWINASSISIQPPGTPPPKAVLGTIQTSPGQNASIISMTLSDTVPFDLDMNDDLSLLTLRLFHTTGYTNWMIYQSSDRWIDRIRWRQEETDVVAVAVRMQPHARLWGWRAYWENGTLKLELRHAPKLAETGSVLKGRTIVIDPGHMPSLPGAVGPRGTLEKDVNFSIAKALEKNLTQEGAVVVMTRTSNEDVGLAARPRIAVEKHGELFISVHNNNLNETVNPFKYPHGFSVFYYQPTGFDLARAVHQAYLRDIPLPDEKLRYGNLLVARITEMPAILTESAYMTFPDQEALLNRPFFQKRLADAMLEGIRKFLEAERERQKQSPKFAEIAPPKPEDSALDQEPEPSEETAPQALKNPPTSKTAPGKISSPLKKAAKPHKPRRKK